MNSLNKWFTVNGLLLNLDKTKVMKFDLNYLHNEIFQSFYKEELIKEVINTQFVRLEIDKYTNWKNHTVHTLPKLSRACYAIRQMYNFSNTEKIKMIYYAYFRSIMKYAQYFGVILWTLKGSFNGKRERQRENYGGG